jgi:hypothetical protein
MTLHTFIEWFAPILCAASIPAWVDKPKLAAYLSIAGCWLFVYWSLTLPSGPAYPVAALDFTIGVLALRNLIIINKRRK